MHWDVESKIAMDVPEGFIRHDRTSPLTTPWEPIFARRESDRIRLGLEIRTETS